MNVDLASPAVAGAVEARADEAEAKEEVEEERDAVDAVGAELDAVQHLLLSQLRRPLLLPPLRSGARRHQSTPALMQRKLFEKEEEAKRSYCLLDVSTPYSVHQPPSSITPPNYHRPLSS